MVIEVKEKILLVEVLVKRFHYTERGAEYLLGIRHIRSVGHPVCMLPDELRRKSRDGSGLREASLDVNEEIETPVQHLAQPREIVVQVGKMASNENGFGMSFQRGFEGLDQIVVSHDS